MNRFIKIINNIILIPKIKIESRILAKVSSPHYEFKSDCTSFLIESDIRKIKEDADRILDGEYQIYNFRAYKKLVWNQDPLSGCIMKNSLSIDLMRTSVLYNKADVKNIWEQAHLHPLVTLAQCYIITGSPEYALKIVEIVRDFYAKNPCGQSIAWKCSMDSAIRLANIVHSVSKIVDSYYFKENEGIISRCIFEHVLFISANYEDKGTYPNNHYLTDLVGVIWGSVYLNKNYGSHKALLCFDDAFERLKSEVLRQINQDGFDYEFSTYYHCFVTELLFETQNMLSKNNISIPAELSNTIEKMMNICNTLGSFSGTMPLIGDQDGSRLFHYKGCFDIDRCDFSSLGRFSDVSTEQKTTFGGIYVLKQDSIKIYFKCGSIGTSGKGTHDHNDQLSVCVFIDNHEIICDSGTFCYTSNLNKRKEFRSVKAHSTVFFDEMEQNDISSVFSMHTDNYGRVIQSGQSTIGGEFVYSGGTRHERTVSINDGIITIKDIAKCGTSRLVVPVPQTAVERINEYKVFFVIDSLRITITSNDKIEINEATISKAYGVESDASYLDSKCSTEHIYYIQKEVC